MFYFSSLTRDSLLFLSHSFEPGIEAESGRW